LHKFKTCGKLKYPASKQIGEISMKMKFFTAVFIIAAIIPAYCGGLTEKDLVNIQEIELENIDSIDIVYSWENISVFKTNSNNLVLKEYMSINKSKYYAHISNFGGKVLIEKGARPFGIGTGILFNVFNARMEVYLPASYTKNIKVKASSGNVILDKINGTVSAETSSGRIELNRVTGSISAKAASGAIKCAVAENAGNVSLATSSGKVTLGVPRNLVFKFSSKTSSGRLSTPFSEKLSSPLSDRNSAEGIIGNETISNDIPNIDIRTKSGTIKIDWAG
jgi:hypothetical protein